MTTETMTPIAAESLTCAYCRHPESEHRRAPGGTLRICRRRVTYGSGVDIRLCGCRAFRRPDSVAGTSR